MTCQTNCIGLLSIHEKKRNSNNDSFEETELLRNCTAHNEDDGIITTICSGVVDMDNNGSYIYCFEAKSENHSTAIEVLVQG